MKKTILLQLNIGIFSLAMFSSCSKVLPEKLAALEAASPTVKTAASLAVDNVGSYTHYSIPDNLKETTTRAEVEVTVTRLGNLNGKLLFPALQTNFVDDAGHIGIQNADGKRVNWGGYFKEFTTPSYRYTPFFNNGPNVTDENEISPAVVYNPDPNVKVEVGHFSPNLYTQAIGKLFNWQNNVTYRYIVERGTKKDGYYRWNGTVVNLSTNESTFIGTLYSKTSYISWFLVWVETDFGDNTVFDVRWKNPRFKSNGTYYNVDKNEITAEVSNNPNVSVVVPSQSEWTNYGTTWHRNGLVVPSSAYKFLKSNSKSW